MLATCVVSGWDTAAYRHPEHPLQRAITDTIVELSGEPVVAVTVDGCGAPLHALRAGRLARAFGRIATAAPAARRPASTAAIRAEPVYLGGTHRQVTHLVREADGLIAKDGAESVYVWWAARRPRRRREDRRRVPAGQAVVLAAVLRRLGRGRRPRSTTLRRHRCSATAIPSAPSSPSVSEGGWRRMRAVLQRVTSASVTVDGVLVGAIDRPGSSCSSASRTTTPSSRSMAGPEGR
jgi:hypothetical protein